jgi:hypothetical protein
VERVNLERVSLERSMGGGWMMPWDWSRTRTTSRGVAGDGEG